MNSKWTIESLQAKVDAKTAYIIELKSKNKELLETCETIEQAAANNLNDRETVYKVYEIAKAAIAKAEGKQRHTDVFTVTFLKL